MAEKSALKSKTVWFNVLAPFVVLGAKKLGLDLSDDEVLLATTTLVSVGNVLLRKASSMPIFFFSR